MAVISRAGTLLAIVAALSAPTFAQRHEPSEAAGGPFTPTAILDAPFSAEAITKVREALSNGTVLEQTVTARYYRDSRGRVRAELDTPWGPYVMLAIPGTQNLRSGVAFYRLDPATRTYRLAARSIAVHLFNGEGLVALPVAKACFQHWHPVGGASEAERLRAVNAEVSPDLGIVTASHRSDKIASVDYQVTNIRRNEPPAELFDVPTDYMPGTGSHDDPLVSFAPWQSPPACKPLTR
jgi:hypothetical protein